MMAQFHVGQRVRIVRHERSENGIDPFGQEGVVVGNNGKLWRYSVRLPVRMSESVKDPDIWLFHGRDLVPLTDPKADAFIERIKKLGKEPINDAPKVTVTK